MKRFLIKMAVLPFLISPLDVFSEPDYAREQRLSDEIIDAILDGEAEELSANGRKFLSIHMESEADTVKGAVLIMHGRGFHPDWTDTIQPLRTGLPEAGWNTLSIQMPVLEKTAKYNEYVPVFSDANERIESALEFLKAQGNKKIILVAHSCGSHMAQHWILNKGEAALSQFDAYIGIGMGATDYKQPMQEPFVLNKMPMPILDVFGVDDYPAVHRLAEERMAMIEQAGNRASAQIIIPEANHYFTGEGEALTEAIASWLDELNF